MSTTSQFARNSKELIDPDSLSYRTSVSRQRHDARDKHLKCRFARVSGKNPIKKKKTVIAVRRVRDDYIGTCRFVSA